MHPAFCLAAGPFAGGRSATVNAGWLLLVVLLTVLTQIGGIVLWLACGIGTAAGRRRTATTLAAFVAGYAVATLLLVPLVASAVRRVPLPCLESPTRPYAAASPLYCALNRHYARPETRDALARIAASVAAASPGTVVGYPDGAFPFAGLPLLPHLSHGDGRRLDIALFYDGRQRGGAWPVGYWAFAPAGALKPRPDVRGMAHYAGRCL